MTMKVHQKCIQALTNPFILVTHIGIYFDILGYEGG